MVYLLAFILMLFFEGLLLTLMPEQWKEIMIQLIQMPQDKIRMIGFIMCSVAVALLLLLHAVKGAL